MEHLVPEQMFSTDTQKAQGISAVKALAIASQQGQKIWTITESNLELALSKINLGVDTENDIRNSVYAGKVVTAHETQINLNGWIGEGYISFDPVTGSGAYQIAGGGNGGDLVLDPRDMSVIGTLSVFDILTFLAGLIPNLFGAISTVIFGLYSLYGTIDVLLNGRCAGSALEIGFAIFYAILLFPATLLPLILGFGILASIVLTFLFSSIQLYAYEDIERRCSVP